MKLDKTVVHFFSPWAYDNEVYELDEMSEDGWQLEELYGTRRVFTFDNSVVYRYALDYRTEKNPTGPDYLNDIEERGWELVDIHYESSHRLWYCFRKLYDPSLPEEEYIITPDAVSINHMKKSWAMWSVLWFVLLLAMMITYYLWPSMFRLLAIIALLAYMVNYLLMNSNIRDAKPGRRKYRRSFSPWFFRGVALVAVILVLIFARAQASATCTLYKGPASATPERISYTIRLPDFYAIQLRVDSDDPVSFIMEKDDGTVITSSVLTRYNNRFNMFLWPGTYTVTAHWEADVPAGDIRVDLTGQ